MVIENSTGAYLQGDVPVDQQGLTTQVLSEEIPLVESSQIDSAYQAGVENPVFSESIPTGQDSIVNSGLPSLSMGASPLGSLVRSPSIGTRLSPINFSQSGLTSPSLSVTTIGKRVRVSNPGGRLSTVARLPFSASASRIK